MSTDISLDHIGTIVGDLDRAATDLERLGFRLSRTSPQMGYTGPDGALETWATANRCAVFRRGYVELIGVVAPGRFNPWQRFLDRFEGVHITALCCRSADEAWTDLESRAPGLDPPVARRRDAPYGRDDTREMRFRNIFSRDDQWPEGRFIVIEHQTPEVLWQDDLMLQPNGAEAIVEAFLCADRPDATVARLSALTGVAAEAVAPGEVLLPMPAGGSLRVVETRRARERWPGFEPPPRPCMVGCAIAFADPEVTAGHMAASGARIGTGAGGAVFVSPEAAAGILMELRPIA